MIDYTQQQGYRCLVDGTNADDADDHRPGRQAARERGVRSPLQEAGLTKAEIRNLAHALELPNWNKPATPCLSSRIAYGVPVTESRLAMIDRAEQFLHEHGFTVARVRLHERELAYQRVRIY